MKKFLSFTLIFFALILVGCGNNKKNMENSLPEEDAILIANSFWVSDSENMAFLNDAIARKDTEYLNQLMLEGKVFKVDKDTKVKRFGVAADNNHVLISFKEGRYTNKAGCTFAGNVFTLEKYQLYLEAKQKETEKQEREYREYQEKIERARQEQKAQEQAQKDAERQKILEFIQNFLVQTDNYMELMKSGNVNELKRINDLCKAEELKIIEIKSNPRIDFDIRECAAKAHKIMMYRCGAVIFIYLKYNSINMNEYQKAEQLRQEFHDKYGY